MIQTQQESIDALNQILSQLLQNKKKPKAKTLSKKSKDKQKERESSSSTNIVSEEHSNYVPPKSSSEGEENSENGSSIFKKMSKLEQRLEALANRNDLHDVGIIRSYQAE